MFVADKLLSLWLVKVPEDSALFLRLIMITTMYDAISNPFAKAIQATGHIRKYQIVFSTFLILVVPISYLVLKFGADAYIVFVVHIILGFIAMCSRIILALHAINIPLKSFLNNVIYPILIVSVLSIAVSYTSSLFMPEGFMYVFIMIIITILIVMISIYFFGLGVLERSMIKDKIKKIIMK